MAFMPSLHIDIAEVQSAEGDLYFFVAIDRTSKFAFVRLVRKAGKMAAASGLPHTTIHRI